MVGDFYTLHRAANGSGSLHWKRIINTLYDLVLHFSSSKLFDTIELMQGYTCIGLQTAGMRLTRI